MVERTRRFVLVLAVLIATLLSSSLLWAAARSHGGGRDIAVPFPFAGDEKAIGSVSVLEFEPGSAIVEFAMERPGDRVFTPIELPGGVKMALELGEGSILGFMADKLVSGDPTLICLASGSEVRFGGSVEVGGIRVTAKREARLCFRKVNRDWVYLCGQGQVVYKKKNQVVKLGAERTVTSCLALLSSRDPIRREGGVRDLGRLATVNDRGRVAPAIAKLLKDPSPAVRRGATEGLALIGGQECVNPLKAAAASEKNPITKRFIAEALALCAGNTLIGYPSTAQMSGGEAARLYSQGKTGWINGILARRIKARSPAAAQGLIARLNSADPTERLAAVALLDAAECSEARGPLATLAESDADEKVRAAAKSATERWAQKTQ